MKKTRALPEKMEKTILNKYGYKIYRNDNLSTFRLHYHDYYEAELFLGGEGISVINGVEYATKRGSLFFLRPTDLHEIHSVSPFTSYNLPLTVEACEESVFNAVTQQKVCLVTQLSESDCLFAEKLTDKLNQLTWLARPRPEHLKEISKSLITSLLSLFLSSKNLAIPHENASPLLKAVAYVNLNFMNNPTLEEVAAEANLQANYFCKKFKAHTGKTFKDYLNDLKIEYACRILSSLNMSVLDVSFNSGYNSLSQFLREFKKRTGMSPGEYRKTAKNTPPPRHK